ncbi:MAG TPA: CehA/McbA family metallohydrolase, partial [Allosphingosinicella sp.]
MAAGVAGASLWLGAAGAQSVYFGSLHSHTSYSDGSGTPAQAYRAARLAGLDFFAITEHNHPAAEQGAKERADGRLIATHPGLYSGRPASLRETADRLDVPGKFVTLYGQEFSTINSGNHVNVFQVPDVLRVRNGQYDELVAWGRASRDTSGQPPLMQMNHPGDPSKTAVDYGRDDFASVEAWVAALDPFVELIEILSGPALNPGLGLKPKRHETQYFKYLDLGFHAAPSSGQDNHYRNWGTSTNGRVAVIADRLTRTDIMAALRSRHSYVTEDRNLRILFRANGALQGDIAPAPPVGSALHLTVSVHDDDEPNARYKIEVLTDHPSNGRGIKVASTTALQGN